jgi:ATP-dependent Clp protease ATP-binding subunit ClpA
VILFDEIEKAHPDVMNILLQILDDGHITDAHGRKVNFANAVLIMTSNAGSDEKGAGSMGFDRSSNEQAKDKAMKALKTFLRPEFLNRLDDVICFDHLSEESMTKIAHILLKELKASMAEKGLSLTWSDAAAQQLAKMSYSETYGARNLRRCIENEVEDRIVDLIMAQQGAVTRISVGCRSGKLTVQAK